MNNAYSWYSELLKPSWAPPAYVFGPVWTFLYILIAISFGAVFILAWQKKIPARSTVPFVLNLFFNFIFTYLQFGLRSNILAGIDVFLVLLTLLWAVAAIFPYKRWIAYMQIPYLLWVTFATILQFTITFMNW